MEPALLPVPVLGLLSALALTTAVWLLSLARRDVSIIDIFWGPGFVVVARVYLAATNGDAARRTAVMAAVAIWGLRLAAYLAWRNWGEPEDYRYRAMRARAPGRFPYTSLFAVFWLQAVVLWIVAMPIWAAMRSETPPFPTSLDVAGLSVFAAGVLFESIADLQMARFKSDPTRRGKVLDTGLWRYSRHPNYFGDALVWWGLFLLAASTPGSAWTVIGPILMTFLLMKVSGVTLLEKNLERTKPAYRDYVARTSAFLPWPPRSR